MFGFFKFLKELFNGTYFDDNSVNPSDNPGAFVDRPGNNSMVSSGSDTLSGSQRTAEASAKGITGFLNQLGQLIPSLVNRITAAELTGAEREQNAFNAEQAQIDRDFQERMANTQYQRSVADMRAAGVNPALAIGNGGAAAPSGAMAQGSGSADYAGASLGDILQLAMIKPQMELIKAQAQQSRDLGEAALRNAGANERNASTNEGQLGINALLAQNTIRLGDNTIRFTDSQIEEIAQSIEESKSRINLQGLEAGLKSLEIQFAQDTLETRKELLLQELVYKAVEMSNIQAQTSLYYKEGKLLDNEAISQTWKEKHPKLASTLDAAGVTTGVLGNILRGSVSGVLGRWSK